MNASRFILGRYISLKGKTIVITGATSGLGKSVLITCLSKGADVLIASRNEKKMNILVSSLKETYPNSKIEKFVYDQSSLQSIKAFSSFLNSYSFDFLFLNAGIYHPNQNTLTVDGWPLTLGTNIIGLIGLMDLLLPMLSSLNKKIGIIFHGSIRAHHCHYYGKKKDLEGSISSSFHSYDVSKLGVYLLFEECCSKYESSFLRFYLCEPGICSTNIYRHLPNLIKKIANIFVRLVFQSSLAGSLPTLEAIFGNYPSGTIVVPKYLVKGCPKTYQYSKKLLKYEDMLKDIRNYYLSSKK